MGHKAPFSLSMTWCLENKYSRAYFRIIEAARGREDCGYVEKHHIQPRSLGGNNDASNIVTLTAREHYLVHLLLTKMTEGPALRSMTYALSFFNTQNVNLKNRHKPSSRWYEYSKKLLSAARKGKPASKACLKAVSKAKKGKSLSKEQRSKISSALTKSISFFANSPSFADYSGCDLRSFCAAHGLSYHTISKRIVKKAFYVITAGPNKGWVFSGDKIENANDLRAKELQISKTNRAIAVQSQWRNNSKSAELLRKPFSLISPEGQPHTFECLSQVKKFGPVSTIQHAKIGVPIKQGKWKNWIKADYTTD